MTSTLVRRYGPRYGADPARPRTATRTRDWTEIQERMLVPLQEAVYARVGLGPGGRVLELGCGAGLGLVLAAGRGASVAGVDTERPELLAYAERRLRGASDAPTDDGPLLGEAAWGAAGAGQGPRLVASFRPLGCAAGDGAALRAQLARVLEGAPRGTQVVVTGWGPPERCAAAGVLRTVRRLAEPVAGPDAWRSAGRDDLEDVASAAGLLLEGSGRVSCPFGYPDQESAVRGLLSTGLLDAALSAADTARVAKELGEALHPHTRPDGTVWLPNVFRYLVARSA
ncbi:class I SAM-dependent methyltransferase [Streptomyces sp. BRB081]|uniref:class I SAM-dependent methyltransferase n=1 Tax=Streptomyces sp. BRB081 TaxID=2769544 RepID=UPI0018ACF16E|nr:SAM-dependent methyltransferase [Streptomyces sp. BRB081]MBL3804104.1 SAM-dependent methyltransferase [Streptomyces sp. BRB081]